MRHRIAGNRLSRNSSLRKATLRDMARATLIRERITTTKAKAKEARKLVEKLITLGKNGTLAAKRRAFAILCDHQLVSDLFDKTSPRFKSRMGGYTRIIPLGVRRGDNAQLVLLELTEKSEVVLSKPKVKKKKETLETPDVVDVQAEAKTVKEEKPKAEHQQDVKSSPKEVHPPKDAVKAQQDKANPGKKIIANLRTMFNRKTGSS